MKKEKYPYGDRWFYTFIKPLLVFLIYLFFRPTVIGMENVPTDGPIVLAGNHKKWADPEMLCAIVKKRQVHFLAKIELFHKFFTRFICWGMGAIPVDRKAHDGKALKYAEDALKRSLCIGIFPEGTINRTDETIMPFKKGAVRMCYETGSLLVPFVITGEYKWFRKGITVEFLKPMKVGENLEKENDRLMKIIKSKLEEGDKKNERKSKSI